MLLIRRIHAYIGLVIAPGVLFFACSGFLQIFSLHEARGGYHPPAVIETLGNLHKDQVLSEPGEHNDPPVGAPAPETHAALPEDAGHDHEKVPKISTYVLKWFFALVAIGLAVSTGLGLWVGLRFTRTPRLSWGLLAFGAVVPLLILMT